MSSKTHLFIDRGQGAYLNPLAYSAPNFSWSQGNTLSPSNSINQVSSDKIYCWKPTLAASNIFTLNATGYNYYTPLNVI